MADEIRLEFDSLPALPTYYLKAATTLSGGLSKGETIPDIVAEVPDLEVRADNLAQYRKVCGFRHSDYLPVTYPHALAFPVHLAVMTHKKFPLKLLGLIHLRNEITQYRAIKADEKLHLEVSVGGHNEVAKGVEFDLVTRVRDRRGEVMWQENSTFLFRQKTSVPKPEKKDKNSESVLGFEPDKEVSWEVAENVGRRYARAAGDFNPIHLSPWTAKLFGFPRHIATGMWMKARAAAEMEPLLEERGYTLTLAFKKPLFLPGKARFAYKQDEAGLDYALISPEGEKPHIAGSVRYT